MPLLKVYWLFFASYIVQSTIVHNRKLLTTPAPTLSETCQYVSDCFADILPEETVGPLEIRNDLWIDPLLSAQYITNGVAVALKGELDWGHTEIVNDPDLGEIEQESPMGSQDGGAIATISDPEACPYFSEIFSVTNKYGVEAKIKISEPVADGCTITLESWSVPRAFYGQYGAQDVQIAFHFGNFDHDVTDTPQQLDTLLTLFFENEEGTEIEEVQQEIDNAHSITLDGIVYISQKIESTILSPTALTTDADECQHVIDCLADDVLMTSGDLTVWKQGKLWEAPLGLGYIGNGAEISLHGTVEWIKTTNGTYDGGLIFYETLMGSADDGLIATIPNNLSCPHFDQSFDVTNEWGLESEIIVHAPVYGVDGCDITLESWGVPRVYYTSMGAVELQVIFTIGDFDNKPTNLSYSEPMKNALEKLIQHYIDDEGETYDDPRAFDTINNIPLDGIVFMSQKMGTQVLSSSNMDTAAKIAPLNEMIEEPSAKYNVYAPQTYDLSKMILSTDNIFVCLFGIFIGIGCTFVVINKRKNNYDQVINYDDTLTETETE